MSATKKTAAKKKGRVDVDRTRESMERLLEAEIQQREERRIKTSLRLSGLPTGYTLADFDWAFQPSIKKNRIETLATCA